MTGRDLRVSGRALGIAFDKWLLLENILKGFPAGNIHDLLRLFHSLQSRLKWHIKVALHNAKFPRFTSQEEWN